jgi:hypothetical protein
MILTVTLAALLAQSPQAVSAKTPDTARGISQRPAIVRMVHPTPHLALELHPMTDEEKKLFPGRERFDKTEWYESLFKSMKIVLLPEHVDEWNNGGREIS